MILFRTLALAAIVAATAGLSACTKKTEAPTDSGICYHVGVQADGTLKYNVVAKNQARMENCAVELERMRLRFLSLGGSNREVLGAFQGSFIWVAPQGVFIAQSLEGHRYPSLYRDEDGRLIIRGAEPATPGTPAAQ